MFVANGLLCVTTNWNMQSKLHFLGQKPCFFFSQDNSSPLVNMKLISVKRKYGKHITRNSRSSTDLTNLVQAIRAISTQYHAKNISHHGLHSARYHTIQRNAVKGNFVYLEGTASWKFIPKLHCLFQIKKPQLFAFMIKDLEEHIHATDVNKRRIFNS